MACTLKKADVVALVTKIIEDDNPDYRPITEDTPLGDQGLRLDGARRRTYFVPVCNALALSGCGLPELGPASFANTAPPDGVSTVGELCGLVFKKLGTAMPVLEAFTAADALGRGAKTKPRSKMRPPKSKKTSSVSGRKRKSGR
jgi:hypothetical protein